MRSIGFFDFDGTLYQGDSMLDFIAMVYGKKRMRQMLLNCSGSILMSLSGFISSQKPKEKLLTLAFKDKSYASLEQFRQLFSKSIDSKIFPAAKKQIEALKAKKCEIVIISASTDLWLEPWCSQNGFKLICSQLALKDNKITGKLIGNNCKGKEKVRRIKSEFNLEEYDSVYAYGNSRSDRFIQSLSNQPTLKLYQ